MYYIASLDSNDIEEACDFGFDMVERIILDECFKSLKKIPPGLIKEKRFCVYDHNPSFNKYEIMEAHVVQLCSEYGIGIDYENCVATVLNRPCLDNVLKKIYMKINNLAEWRCKNSPLVHGLFDSVVVYDPYIMRNLLSEKKYGIWDHSRDRDLALQVLNKLIGFLKNNYFDALVLYNEIFCSRWDSVGQIHFDTSGRVCDYHYYGEGKAYSYLYAPGVNVWQRV